MDPHFSSKMWVIQVSQWGSEHANGEIWSPWSVLWLRRQLTPARAARRQLGGLGSLAASPPAWAEARKWTPIFFQKVGHGSVPVGK